MGFQPIREEGRDHDKEDGISQHGVMRLWWLLAFHDSGQQHGDDDPSPLTSWRSKCGFASNLSMISAMSCPSWYS